MAEFIEESVGELSDSSSSESVDLLIGTHGDRDELGVAISERGGEVLEEVGRTTLKVRISERRVDELFELDIIASIEMDSNDVHLQDQGDFRRQTNSMM